MSLSHAELVQRAARWLRNTKKCGVVLTERKGYSEAPDAIGWRYGPGSILVECKASRSDFFADRKKPFRQNPDGGMGQTRYYLTPPRLIKPEEVPEGWGLLWAFENFVRVVREPMRTGVISDERCRWEIHLLYSELWRYQNGIYAAPQNTRENRPQSLTIDSLPNGPTLPTSSSSSSEGPRT